MTGFSQGSGALIWCSQKLLSQNSRKELNFCRLSKANVDTVLSPVHIVFTSTHTHLLFFSEEFQNLHDARRKRGVKKCHNMLSCSCRGWRYVLKIHFFIESVRKMIQFKIHIKTKSKIFIQKNIHSIESRIFSKIIHSQKNEENYSKFQNKAKKWLGSPPEALYR